MSLVPVLCFYILLKSERCAPSGFIGSNSNDSKCMGNSPTVAVYEDVYLQKS